jgi:hypothetical protein
MKFITSLHNSLPANRKTKEIAEILRKTQKTLLTEEEYEEFIACVKTLVDVGNALYPKTSKLWVRVGQESIAVALDGSDKSCYLGVATVENTWSDIEKSLPLTAYL